MTSLAIKDDFLKRVLFLLILLWGLFITYATTLYELKGFLVSLLIIPFVFASMMAPFVSLAITTLGGTTFVRLFMAMAGIETAYVLYVALGIFALFGGIVLYFKNKQARIELYSADFFFILLLMIFSLGLFYSTDPERGLLKVGTFVVGGFFPYFALLPLRGEIKSLKKLMWLGIAILAITSIATTGAIIVNGVSSWQRFTFANAGPISFSRNFALTTLLSIMLFDYFKNKNMRIAMLLLALLSIAILVAVATRGPVIALAGALIIHFLFFSEMSLPKRVFTVAIMGAFGAFVAFRLFDFLIVRMSAIQGAEFSAVGRVYLWKIAFSKLSETPLWGFGTSSFQSLLTSFGKGADLHYPHNIWLEYYLEWGIIGLGALLLFLFSVVKRGFKPLLSEEMTSDQRATLKISLTLFFFALANCQVSGDFSSNRELWIFSSFVLASSSYHRKSCTSQ